MNRFKRWRRADFTCIGMMAVIVSLFAMLGLQYQSLIALERATAAEHRAMLMNYLAEVTAAVESFYRTTAEQALQIVPTAIPSAPSFEPPSQPLPGVDLIFTAWIQRDALGIRFYQPTGIEMSSLPEAGLVRAIHVAVAPWQVLSQQGVRVDDEMLHPHERASAYRMILKPLTDAASRVIGLFGVVVDPQYLAVDHLPNVIETSLVEFCSQAAQDNAIITVHNGRNQLIFSTQPLDGHDDEVSRPLQFLFTDWRLGIRSRYVTPEQWARQYFAMNVTLSIAMTAVLIAGIVITLRAASYAMRLSQMKTDFVSNVSHELRTPLASIRVFSEFLRLGRACGGI